MKRIALLLVAVVMAAGVVAAWARTYTRADAEPAPRSAKDVRGASPYAEIKNEPPPRLFVDDPLPEGLAQGIVWIQWRVENLNVVPVFGKGAALNVSPRVGHLHVHVDDVGWWWADPSGVNTIRHRRAVGRPPQGAARIGERQPRALPRTVQDGDVHHTERGVPLSQSLPLPLKVAEA
jgi:hypothetical protein